MKGTDPTTGSQLQAETSLCHTSPRTRWDAAHVCSAGKGSAPTQERTGSNHTGSEMVSSVSLPPHLLGTLANAIFDSLSVVSLVENSFLCSVIAQCPESSTVRPLSRWPSLQMVSSSQRLSTTCFLKFFSWQRLQTLSCTCLSRSFVFSTESVHNLRHNVCDLLSLVLRFLSRGHVAEVALVGGSRHALLVV